ncbi:MAG: efflux RND transporter periplasmic adaptor subunit [bacterium]|nr:efflux RND transporter periplasmic adaptor subunit [bacterium]
MKYNSTKYLVAVACVLALVLFFNGCTKKVAEAQNINRIHKEEGVPVRAKTVVPTEFSTVLSFHSVLTGIQESTAFSAMGDKVERVLVKVGDWVKKDQVLVTFPTDSPSAPYFQAKVAFENARTAFKRVEGLYKIGGISLQERDNAKAQFDVAEADWNGVKQMVKVKAPIGGYVTKVHVSETDNVDKEMRLVTIARTEKLKAEIWVSEDEISRIKFGMPATAFWKGFRITGTVTQVDIAMSSMKKAFRAVVAFDNKSNELMAGTTVDVAITTSSKTGTVVVERKDIVKDRDKHFVFIVKNGKSEKREIKTGDRQGLDVEVLEGLESGDELVVEGQMLLDHGSKVKVVGPAQ